MKKFLHALKERFSGKPLAVRSTQWPTVRNHFLEQHNVCAACGRKDKLEVHHIKPFHLDKNLELDPNNLITLCEQEDTRCHLVIGHLNNWKRENVNVIRDARNFLKEYNEKIKMI